jgi:hypothetical protein
MFILLSLIACDSSTSTTSDLSEAEPGEDTHLLEAAAISTGEDLSRGLATLSVQLPSGEGFVEVRAYREELGKVVWTGASALSLRELEGPRADLGLPLLPPAVDRVNLTSPVNYAISLRSATAAGYPGAFVGLAESRLVYIPKDPPAGAVIGWNIAANLHAAHETWLPLSRVVVFEENLTGGASLTLGGATDLPLGPDSRLASLTEVEGSAALSDAALGRTWSVSLAAAPDATALADTDHNGTALSIYAYEDEDGDRAYTDDGISGELCTPAGPGVITWYKPAGDLATAMWLDKHGLRSGYGVGTLDDRGYTPVPVDQLGTLYLAKECVPPAR